MKLLAALAVTLAFAAPAAAHPPKSSGVPSLHKLWNDIEDQFRDPPPRPGPQTPCDDSNVGQIEREYDAKLGAWVEWECRSDGRWYRLRIVPDQYSQFWRDQPRRIVWDRQRACDSIVCLPVRVKHRYHVYRLLPQRVL